MLIQSVVALISFTIPVVTEATASNEDGSCSANFKICAPAGVKSDTLGPIGPAWGDLYNDIVNVVSDYGISSQPLAGSVDLEEQAGVFCCMCNLFSLRRLLTILQVPMLLIVYSFQSSTLPCVG